MKKKMVCILMAGVMASLVPAQMVFAEGDSGEKTVVKFQTWNPGDEEYTHAMLEKFEEEHPDIQIDYTFMPYTCLLYTSYTPFIPLDADNSGIPTAIIKYKVSNPTNKPIRCV